jgi:predicted TIM-barrel fold metal-dependent hydrolase
MPAAVVDAHIHQWDPFTTPRRVTPAAKIVGRAPFLESTIARLIPGAVREYIGDPRYLLRPYLPADYAADAAPLPVATVVHIEADWNVKHPLDGVAETEWISGSPFGEAGIPALGAIVVHADPSHPAAPAVLDAHLRASPLVRGVRCVAASSPDPGIASFATSPNLLAAPAFVRGFAAVAERGLAFDVCVYAHQIPSAVTLAREYPETTFVLDHYGSPAGVLGPRGHHTGNTFVARKAIFDRWRDDIDALAALPNTVAKHSGLGMSVLGLGPVPRSALCEAVAPLVTHLHNAFGPERTFWGSNYPIDKPNLALLDSIAVLDEILTTRFDATALLHHNACRPYQVQTPPPAPDD